MKDEGKTKEQLFKELKTLQGRLAKLERVETERKKTEKQILRQSAVLDAINKVFRETLKCETDEEVARTCLAVAEELTGSKFGWIGEVNESGRFDTIALSDPGWKACRMPKSDAVRIVKDMEVRGIWGRVLKDGRSLIVNDPASHPDRVGIPESHPPLTSFLGVPLKREGKTIGMIALANKGVGYNSAEQEDIEALSVAFLEALIRKRAEDHIQHLQNVLKAIRDINQLIVHEKNQKKLLQGACEILNQTRDYKMVWIGLVEEGTKDVLPTAQAGFEKGYLKSVKITWDDSEVGNGPTGTAIKTKKPFVMRDIAGDPRYQSWRVEAIKRGYVSSAAVPLVHENRVFGALNVYAGHSDAFEEEEIGLLVEVGQDIAFALRNIELEEERKLAEEGLKRYREYLEELVKERTADLGDTREALVSTLQDMIQAKEELEKANTKLQELDRLKSMFIASMSHELRTPLNSIIGFTGIILQGMTGKITGEQRKQLTMVKNSANHLLNLINDIIDLSKIEADKIELAIEEFDLSGLVQEVKDSFRVAAEEKGLKLSLKMPKRLVIKGDERRIRQVLVNLVSNAVKFTDRGEIGIKVTKKDGMVEVSVKDTGIGIRKEDMDRLFKAFGQVPLEGRPTQEGTGLGLYLSKKIAGILGGKIWAESKYGRGSEFTFALPLEYKAVRT